MTHTLQFKIVTPERVVFEDTVSEVILPTVDGEIAVLPNHIPLVTLLAAGVLRIKKNGEETGPTPPIKAERKPVAKPNGVKTHACVSVNSFRMWRSMTVMIKKIPIPFLIQKVGKAT